MDRAMVGLGGSKSSSWTESPPNFFYKKLLLYIWVLILKICFKKLHFCSLKNIVNYFKSTVIVTIVNVANSYWFALELITYIINNL